MARRRRQCKWPALRVIMQVSYNPGVYTAMDEIQDET